VARTFSPEDLQPEDLRAACATEELVAELDSPSKMASGLDAHSFDSARINLRFGTVGLSKLRPKTQTMKLQAATDSALHLMT
jgi:hypothetical protein